MRFRQNAQVSGTMQVCSPQTVRQREKANVWYASFKVYTFKRRVQLAEKAAWNERGVCPNVARCEAATVSSGRRW